MGQAGGRWREPVGPLAAAQRSTRGKVTTPLTVTLTPQTLRKWTQDAEATRPKPFLKRVPRRAVGEGWARKSEPEEAA
jgi:hypothetical protein